jgi:hypothetical protein
LTTGRGYSPNPIMHHSSALCQEKRWQRRPTSPWGLITRIRELVVTHSQESPHPWEMQLRLPVGPRAEFAIHPGMQITRKGVTLAYHKTGAARDRRAMRLHLPPHVARTAFRHTLTRRRAGPWSDSAFGKPGHLIVVTRSGIVQGQDRKRGLNPPANRTIQRPENVGYSGKK